MGTRILLVDQTSYRGDTVQRHLSRNGLPVDTITNAAASIVAARRASYALILVSTARGRDGIDICRAIRRAGATPIIVLGALADEEDAQIVAVFEAGADDFIAVPFSPSVLVARIKAVLRRCPPVRAGNDMAVHVADVMIDIDRRLVHVGDDQIALRAKEFAILVALARRPGVVLSRDQLVAEIWTGTGETLCAHSRSIDMHISALRSLLTDSRASIKTVWGIGYKLSDESAEATDTAWQDTGNSGTISPRPEAGSRR